jgi:hypothetical protein
MDEAPTDLFLRQRNLGWSAAVIWHPANKCDWRKREASSLSDSRGDFLPINFVPDEAANL